MPTGDSAGDEAGDSADTGSADASSSGAVSAAAGESVYQKSCGACHNAGVAGAPKLGDAAAWSERLAQGVEMLESNAINGFQGSAGMMPAKGGNTSLSDDEVRSAVAYMLESSK